MTPVRPGQDVLRHMCRSCFVQSFLSSAKGSRRHYRLSNSLATSLTVSAPKLARPALWLFLAGSGALFLNQQGVFGLRDIHAEAKRNQVEIVVEQPVNKLGISKEEHRDLISNQHQQVKRSWENPGVYAWGSNSGKAVAPDSDETVIKNPRRIAFFDGEVLRDLKLSSAFGAAISEKGDLYQWGADYSLDEKEPVKTLTGKNLVSLSLSDDRIIALSSSGVVYSLPVSRKDQLEGPRLRESSWIPFWSTKSPISYRTIKPDLSWSERIVAISSGLQHLLILTSTGRVFSSAASSSAFPTRGQLGIPGLTWNTRPEGPYDMPHELGTLRGFNIVALATGDYHSLVLDSEGRIFSFGDNSTGQLAQEPSSEITVVDAPSLVPLTRLYMGTRQSPSVTSIAAGGSNSFFTVNSVRVPRSSEDVVPQHLLGRVTSDTWACGEGIKGQLGTGRWTHVQGTPVKIKALSGLFEYDETHNRVIPIELDRLSVGASHAAAILANVTYISAQRNNKGSENDTNWGADVLWWGGNEFYQLGTGKRNNCAQPVYIGPLDAPTEGGKREANRLHLTPRNTVNLNGRWVTLEQRVECGRFGSAVYSATA